MPSKLLLLLILTTATTILSTVAAAEAIMHDRIMQDMGNWSYNEILEARGDPTLSLMRPCAAFAWCAALLLSIMNLVVFYLDRRKCSWLLPAIALSFALVSGAILLMTR